MAAEDNLSDDQFHPISIAAEAARRDLPNRYSKLLGARHEATDVQLEGIHSIEPGNPDPDHTHVGEYSFTSSLSNRRHTVSVGLSPDERKPRSYIWKS